MKNLREFTLTKKGIRYVDRRWEERKLRSEGLQRIGERGSGKHGPRLSIDEDPNIRLSQTPTTRRGHCSRLLGNDLLPFVLRSLYYTGKGGEIAAGGRASLADGFGD